MVKTDHEAAFTEVARLIEEIKPPGDESRTSELLEFYLSLTQTVKEKIGAIDDGVSGLQVLTDSIQRLQSNLAEIGKTIAQVGEQIEDVVQQRSELEAENTRLEGELKVENTAFEAKDAEWKAKDAERKEKRAAFEKRFRDVEEAERLIAELETEMPKIAKGIEEIKNENPDFALRVNDTGQKFHETVEQFLQSKRKGYKIIGQIKELLRLSPGKDLEPLNLSTAIGLIDKIAKDLGDLDRRLGALTRKLDATR